MPSDPRVTECLAALAQPIAEFRALIRDALTRAEAFAALQDGGLNERVTQARAGLGRFAEGRIDPARFAALVTAPVPASPASRVALRGAIDTLRTVLARGDEVFVLDVPPGGRVNAALRVAFGEIGRAFGAVILTDLIRTGRYRQSEHDRLLDPIHFSAWNSVERRIAPPLVVTLDGADLHAGALTMFADGHEKIVMVLRGECAPAPLVRCITPGTLVVQATDAAHLDRLSAFKGPAIAAIMPNSAATFVHDPAGGREAWQRLQITNPGAAPKRPIGGASVWQMTEDLALLAELVRIPLAVANRSGAAAPLTGDVVDRITTWLLGQAGAPGT